MATFRRRSASAPLVAALALLLAALPVSAATRTVTMTNESLFVSASLTALIGDTVRWENTSTIPHDVHATAPLLFFESGADGGMAPGATFSWAVPAAGTFRYLCKLHGSGMSGSVAVPVRLTRLTGPVRARIVVAEGLPSGWRSVIQARKGSGAWSTIRTTTSASFTWTPPSRGTWTFRSRLEKVSAPATRSDWSPVRSLSL